MPWDTAIQFQTHTLCHRTGLLGPIFCWSMTTPDRGTPGRRRSDQRARRLLVGAARKRHAERGGQAARQVGVGVHAEAQARARELQALRHLKRAQQIILAQPQTVAEMSAVRS